MPKKNVDSQEEAEAKALVPDKYKMDETRQPGEPIMWYARFHIYLLLGPDRSILAAYRAERTKREPNAVVQKVPQQWAELSKRWEWEDRAARYDSMQLSVQRKAFERRKEKFVEKQMEVAEKMLDKASSLADLPIVRRIATEGGSTYIFEPITFDASDIPRLAGEGARLGRQAMAIEEAPSKNLNVNVNTEVSPRDTAPVHIQDFEWLKELAEPLQESAPPTDTGSNDNGNGKNGNGAH